MDLLDLIILNGVQFGRNVVGIILRPYETCRRITQRARWGELVYILLALVVYFALASLVKVASFRPFLLTRHFLVLTLAALLTYSLVVFLLGALAKAVGGKGNWRSLAVAWGYTLIPTLIWFLATSVLYVLIPPPRTTTILGLIFSFLYLVFSATLLFWKVNLAYLTLRFGMKLDLLRICLVSGITLGLIILYSLLMYRWGIYKLPFV